MQLRWDQHVSNYQDWSHERWTLQYLVPNLACSSLASTAPTSSMRTVCSCLLRPRGSLVSQAIEHPQLPHFSRREHVPLRLLHPVRLEPLLLSSLGWRHRAWRLPVFPAPAVDPSWTCCRYLRISNWAFHHWRRRTFHVPSQATPYVPPRPHVARSTSRTIKRAPLPCWCGSVWWHLFLFSRNDLKQRTSHAHVQSECVHASTVKSTVVQVYTAPRLSQ